MTPLIATAPSNGPATVVELNWSKEVPDRMNPWVDYMCEFTDELLKISGFTPGRDTKDR